MSYLKFLLAVSRPRFWLYTLGPYLIGVAAAAENLHELQQWKIAFFGLLFLFPANLLIYGINDIFDYETDKLNAKKSDYETLVEPKHRRKLFVAILFINLPFLVVTLVMFSQTVPAMAGFLFFSIFYSVPPIRAKTKPIIDSIFNILYVFPAIFSYKLISNEYPSILVITAAGYWTMAMHAYSAIPDIEADRNAKISTIATFLGSSATHFFCLALYVAAASIAFVYIGFLSVAFGTVYVTLMLISLRFSSSNRVFDIYRIFPWINISVGFILFWYVVLYK